MIPKTSTAVPSQLLNEGSCAGWHGRRRKLSHGAPAKDGYAMIPVSLLGPAKRVSGSSATP
jgi:hypothetical protein